MATSQTRARIALALGLLLAVTLLGFGGSFTGVTQQVGYTLGLLTPARAITIVADGQEIALEVRVATVEEALAAAKIVLGEHDRVSPEPAGKIQDQMEIVVTRVTKSQIVEHERIYSTRFGAPTTT